MLLVAGLLALPRSAQAYCVRGPVGCSNMGTLRTCMATLMCPAAPYPPWYVMASNSVNVVGCNGGGISTGPVTFTLTATAMTTAPNPRTCSWYFTSTAGVSAGNVSITTADGLPVELMEFSVEPDGAPGLTERSTRERGGED